MRRVIDALANTEQISKAQARNQKENVRFERASFSSTIARSGSAPAQMRNLLRIAASGNKQPIAIPIPTSMIQFSWGARATISKRDEQRMSDTLSAVIKAGWRRPLFFGVCDFPKGLAGADAHPSRCMAKTDASCKK